MTFIAMQSMPVARRMMEMKREGVFEEFELISFLYKPALETVVDLGLDEARIEEIWVSKKAVDQHAARFRWVRTDLDSEALKVSLKRAGWRELEGISRVLWLSSDSEREEALKKILETGSPEERERALASLQRSARKIVVLDGGWAVLPSEADDLWAPVFARGVMGYPPREAEEKPPFPFSRLFDGDFDGHFVMAVDFAGNDGTEGDALRGEGGDQEVEGSRYQALKNRRDALRKHDQNAVMRLAGDFLVEVSETDGGIALDCVLERPGGGVEGSITLMETILSIAAMASLGVSPDLAREYRYGTVSTSADQVRGTVVIGDGTLLDALDFKAAVKTELMELNAKIMEVEREELRREREKRMREDGGN